MKLTILILLLSFVYCDIKQQSKITEDIPDKASYPEKNSVQSSISSASTFEDERCMVEGRILTVGDSVNAFPPKCYKIHCLEKNKAIFEGCNVTEISPGCHGSFYNMTQIFPKCCPRQVCP